MYIWFFLPHNIGVDAHLWIFIITRATRKVTFGELLTKQAMRWETLLFTKNTYSYIRKLFLNVITTWIKALVLSGNKFLYACAKEVCCLWAQPRFDTFHQLLIIAEELWLQPVLQVGEQVAVAWSEIRAVSRVVKQLPVEMLYQCSSASCYTRMRTRIVMEEHYTVCQHSTPFILNGPTQSF
jgi:hypothetical protein